MIKVGIFWAISDKSFEQSVLEVHKSFYTSEANSLGFINYPYSHFEMWDELRGSYTDNCYYYPRGRVIFNVNKDKHIIYADKCISALTIEDIVELFEIKNYELCRDEHYVCNNCENKKGDKNERSGKKRNI